MMVLIFLGPVIGAFAVDCGSINPRASKPLGSQSLPASQSCVQHMSNGFPIPDRRCTPGAVNPTVTVSVLQSPDFRTSCLRDKATSPGQKAETYNWYNVQHPVNNRGSNQTCELDHLVSLELGGADTLDNIWPECGPPGVALRDRFFKEKDIVENFLAKEVRDGKIPLAEAQKGIAEDWTQYLSKARTEYPSGNC